MKLSKEEAKMLDTLGKLNDLNLPEYGNKTLQDRLDIMLESEGCSDFGEEVYPTLDSLRDKGLVFFNAEDDESISNLVLTEQGYSLYKVRG